MTRLFLRYIFLVLCRHGQMVRVGFEPTNLGRQATVVLTVSFNHLHILPESLANSWFRSFQGGRNCYSLARP